MPCTNEMPELAVTFWNWRIGGGGGGGLSGPVPPPPPPQLAVAPASSASVAARHADAARRLILFVLVPEPEPDLARLAPLVRRDLAAVERLGLDRLVARVRHVDLAVPLPVGGVVAEARVDHRVGGLHAEVLLARVGRAQRARRTIRAVLPAEEALVEVARADARDDAAAVAELEGVRVDDRRLVLRRVRQVVAGEVEHVADAGAARVDAEAAGIPDAA